MGEAMSEQQFDEEEMLRRLKAEDRTPEAAPDLAARVWAGISPQLERHRKPKRPWWMLPWERPLVVIAASVLLAMSFVAGRIWEQGHGSKGSIASDLEAGRQSAAERILMTAAAEHLERSERFLVELQMSRSGNPMLVETAQQLLDDNRLYKQSAVYAKDAAMADVLDRLGRVLAEVAHGEQGINTVPGLAAGDLRLGDLMQAIRVEQRRSPARI